MTAGSPAEGETAGRVLVLVIGDELLDGAVTDRNGATLARAVRDRGGQVAGIALVGDDEHAIAEAISAGLRRADGVLACGGLGPTTDDRTREGVALALGADLVADPGWSERVAERFPPARRLPGMERQARLPRGAEPVDNPAGTALGFGADVGEGRWLLALPGVPNELRAMLDGPAGRYLDARVAGPVTPEMRVGLAGIPESVVARRVDGLAGLEGIDLASYPHHGTVDLLLRVPPGAAVGGSAEEAAARLDRAADALRREFGEDVYEVGRRGLAEVVVDLLRSRREMLAVAESCTGGGLGAAVTGIPGASDVFWGGVIAYADAAKLALLGVQAGVLRSEGAVSEACALAMARGARQAAAVDWGASITGIAGPSGGTDAKPVGTVWIAVTGPREAARRFHMPGGRAAVRRRSVTAALDLLRRLAGAGTSRGR